MKQAGDTGWNIVEPRLPISPASLTRSKRHIHAGAFAGQPQQLLEGDDDEALWEAFLQGQGGLQAASWRSVQKPTAQMLVS